MLKISMTVNGSAAGIKRSAFNALKTPNDLRGSTHRALQENKEGSRVAQRSSKAAFRLPGNQERSIHKSLSMQKQIVHTDSYSFRYRAQCHACCTKTHTFTRSALQCGSHVLQCSIIYKFIPPTPSWFIPCNEILQIVRQRPQLILRGGVAVARAFQHAGMGTHY